MPLSSLLTVANTSMLFVIALASSNNVFSCGELFMHIANVDTFYLELKSN